jgi:hypothetical protein
MFFGPFSALGATFKSSWHWKKKGDYKQTCNPLCSYGDTQDGGGGGVHLIRRKDFEIKTKFFNS